MVVEITKPYLQELYASDLSIAEIAESLTTKVGRKVSVANTRKLFNANGFDLRKRRSIEFSVIDDVETTFQGEEVTEFTFRNPSEVNALSI